MSQDRDKRAALGQEVAAILETGCYEVGGNTVDIAASLELCRAQTRTYDPKTEPIVSIMGDYPLEIEVRNGTTMAAARELFENGGKPAALNFASATKPGGGWLSGARAQEESLARKSCLVAAIDGNEMYAFHQKKPRDPLYTSWVIYSPGVPVIRDENDELLAEPWPCAFLTSPAPNAKVVLERDPKRADEVNRAMSDRVFKVLTVAYMHNHAELVLGAWGCGVFGNDPSAVAEMFGRLLRGQFSGAFRKVIFAILDTSEEKRFIGPFEKQFA